MTESRYKKVEQQLNTIPQYVALMGVDRSKALLEQLGNPQDELSVIHVAGTNGKGSVCKYINDILIENGYHTGLFTSPHLVDIRERIRIDDKYVSKEDFVDAFDIVREAELELVRNGTIERLAYFDYFLGIAMILFKKSQVDAVVMETGLGGRLDSTNAVASPVLSVITSISLEHTAILGDTIEEIAAEKAGIIKQRIPVVYYAGDSKVADVIKEKAREKTSECIAVEHYNMQNVKFTGNHIDFSFHNGYYKNDCFSLSTSALYQIDNCSLALTCAAVLAESGMFKLDEELIRKAVSNSSWEGRMEEILPDVYIDGAHNPAGIRSFIESARLICNGRHCTLLFSVVRDKNFDNMINMLCSSGVFDSYVVTQMRTTRTLNGDSIVDEFKRYTDKSVYETEDVREAWNKARSISDDILMCAGSLYLIGEIKSMNSSGDAAELR